MNNFTKTAWDSGKQEIQRPAVSNDFQSEGRTIRAV